MFVFVLHIGPTTGESSRDISTIPRITMGSLCKHVGYLFHRYKRTQIHIRSPWFQHEIGIVFFIILFYKEYSNCNIVFILLLLKIILIFYI